MRVGWQTEKLVTPGRPRWFETLLVGAALLAVYLNGLGGVAFHADESHWIHTSAALESFWQGQFGAPAWQESYWTLTQPPVARYIIGLGRRIGGYGPADLNLPWDFGLDEDGNAATGRMPFPDLLWWSRLPMALLAVVSLVVGFVLLVRAAGRPAGYLFALLGAVNPYLLDVLRRAMSEAPLLAGTMLAALAGLLGLDGWQRRAAQDRPKGWAFLPPLLWLGLSGLCCGLAGAAKLNGLAGAAAGVALAIAGPLFHQGRRPLGARLAFAVIAPLVVLGSAIGVFVGSNPFLYPDPAGRTLRMAQFRLDEMAVQQQMFDFQRIDGIGERLTIVPQRVLEEYAAIRFGGSEYLNIALGLVGLAALAATAWRWIRRDNPDGAGLTLLLFAAAMVPPALLTPLDWDRYYLLPVFFSTAFIAAGIAWALRWLVRGWLRRQEAGR